MNKISKLKDRLIEIFSSAELPRPFAMTDTLPNYAFEYYERSNKIYYYLPQAGNSN